MEELYLDHTNNIESLYLQGNKFEKIAVGKLPKLKTLQLSENEGLKAVDVKKNKELIQLYLLSTKIARLDVSYNSLLQTLYIDNGVELLKSVNQNRLKPMQVIKM